MCLLVDSIENGDICSECLEEIGTGEGKERLCAGCEKNERLAEKRLKRFMREKENRAQAKRRTHRKGA